jgi:predicted lipoprotein with Yx(FWY)xxD motif
VIQRRIVLLSAAGLASAFLLAACGGSTENTSTGTGPGSAVPVATAASDSSSPVPTAPQSVTSAPAGSGDTATTTTVVARAVQGVGSVVTDDKGMTLYRYDKDQANPSKWTCAGECTKTWIPVIVQDSVQTTGVEKSLLGTVHRNGEKQLTLGGWPLYRYVGDTQAGELNGQAKGGMWYAVTPSGAKSTMTG